MSERHPHKVNVADAEAFSRSEGDRFGFTGRRLAAATGGKGLGCTAFEVPPGRAAFPFHFHCVVEEAIYVLEGEGQVRLGAETVPIKPGDYVTFPVGPDLPHQVINNGSTPLRYLGLSTTTTVELVGYPDSGKFGTWAAGPDGKLWNRVLFRDTGITYYDGEKTE
jgi:uncharacterized cupin superfamily protein